MAASRSAFGRSFEGRNEAVVGSEKRRGEVNTGLEFGRIVWKVLECDETGCGSWRNRAEMSSL
jgi:hypothetical protein